MEDITLVIPAKNEKESLPSVLDELSKYNLKKIVVLEKSDVQTIDAIKHYDLRILFQIKKGYGAALIEGIESVKTKYFVIFNADGSFNPNAFAEWEGQSAFHKSSRAKAIKSASKSMTGNAGVGYFDPSQAGEEA